MFKDRLDAANLLAAKLEKYRNQDGVVLAVPRGGVPIGYYLANYLNFPLEAILTKKIGHPANKEFAIGSVSLHGRILDENIKVPDAYIESETLRIREELSRKNALFMGDHKPVSLTNKIVIVTDDGIATGNTILATIGIIRKSDPKKIIIAVPVLPFEKVKEIGKYADEMVYIAAPYDFYGVGQFYDNFEEVSDEDAMSLLKSGYTKLKH